MDDLGAHEQKKRDRFRFLFSVISRLNTSLLKSLHGVTIKVKDILKRTFQFLKEQRKHLSMDSPRNQKTDVRKKVVYNNSSKQLTEEQLQLLSIGLNLGLLRSGKSKGYQE